MPPRNLTALFVTLDRRDAARLKALAAEDGVSLSMFLRGCINDYMEQIGRDELIALQLHRGRPRKES